MKEKNEKRQVMLRLDEKMIAELEEQAIKERRSKNSMIETMIEKYINEYKNRGKNEAK